MALNKKAIKELQQILSTDYGASISDIDAANFGLSLLRLTRVALTALARVHEDISLTDARGINPLEANTSE